MLNMLAPVMMLALQAAAPEPIVADEIVVIAKKQAKVVFLATSDTKCRVLKGSGDKEIDAIGCDSMLFCKVSLKPRKAAIKAIKDTAERKRQAKAYNEGEFSSCFAQQRDSRIAALADKRRATK